MTFFGPSTASSSRGGVATTVSCGSSRVFIGPFSPLRWFCYTYWKSEAAHFQCWWVFSMISTLENFPSGFPFTMWTPSLAWMVYERSTAAPAALGCIGEYGWRGITWDEFVRGVDLCPQEGGRQDTTVSPLRHCWSPWCTTELLDGVEGNSCDTSSPQACWQSGKWHGWQCLTRGGNMPSICLHKD